MAAHKCPHELAKLVAGRGQPMVTNYNPNERAKERRFAGDIFRGNEMMRKISLSLSL